MAEREEVDFTGYIFLNSNLVWQVYLINLILLLISLVLYRSFKINLHSENL